MNWKKILTELRHYPLGVLEEMGKVDWPSRQETLRLTAVTSAVIVVAALYVSGVDLVFSRLIAFILMK